MQAILVGKVIKGLRYWAQLSQAEVCTPGGLSRSVLSQLEQGRKELSPVVAGRLATVLRVPVSFLYVLVDPSDDPAVTTLYQVTRQALEQDFATRLGPRPGPIPARGTVWTKAEKATYWQGWSRWRTFDEYFPERLGGFDHRVGHFWPLRIRGVAPKLPCPQ